MSESDKDELQQAAAKPGRRKRKRRLTPPIWVCAVLALAAAIIAVLHTTDVTADHAKANVATLIVAFVALMTLLVWFSLLSGYSRWLRWGFPLAGLAVLAVLAVLFRIEGVSSELVPAFAFRFAPKADELLQKPAFQGLAITQSTTVDLRTTGDHDFPQFLGSNRDLSLDRLELDRDWDRRPPELLWRQDIGAGWSAFSVVGRYAVTMEQRGNSEMVTCRTVETGRLCWAHSMATRYDTLIAGVGPRATPTIDEGMVYTLGAAGHLLCLDGATGRAVWERDLLEEFGVTPEDEEDEVPYGRANSPLVVGDLVIVPAGGTQAGAWVSLAAYHKRTGVEVWRGGGRQVSYSSPVLTTLGGIRQVLIVNQDFVSGHAVDTGEVLWEHRWPGKSATNANVSQAVPVPSEVPGLADRVFLSKGYSHGAALIKLLPNGDGTFDTEELWHNSRVMRTKFANVTLRDGYVYGLSDGILECIQLQSGDRIWKGGRYGHGQILRVKDLLLVLAESGELLLVEADPDRRNSVLGRLQALDDKTWNNLALSGPYLLVRNAREAACYRLPLAGQ